MRIYVDVDGTLTNKQTGRSFFKKEIGLREDVIQKVKTFYEQGHEIIIWTGNTEYAKRVALYLLNNYGIKAIAAIGKPEMIIDNEVRKFARRLKKRIMLPEDFVKLP
jgi:hydroxymethylpyrimidine pyrophosphatase-like HAD family hydrolase